MVPVSCIRRTQSQNCIFQIPSCLKPQGPEVSYLVEIWFKTLSRGSLPKLFKWTVPQLSIIIIYNSTWSILIKQITGRIILSGDNLTQKTQRKTPSQAFTVSKQIYRIGRSLKCCGTVHYAPGFNTHHAQGNNSILNYDIPSLNDFSSKIPWPNVFKLH